MPELTARQQKALLLTGMVLGLTGQVVAGGLPLSGGGYEQSGAVSYNATGGANVTISGNINLENGSAFPDSRTVQLNTTDGNVTVIADAHANVSIDSVNITGTWTNATAIDANGTDLQINPEDKRPINVSGDLDSIAYRDTIALDDGLVDFVYAGSSGTTNVTLRGLPANTVVGATDRKGNLLAVNTTDASGTVTLRNMTNSGHTVSLTNGDAPRVYDESPVGKLQSAPSEISVDVNDSDFPDGDNVTVEFRLNGSTISTQHIQSNQTVTASIPTSGRVAGTHKYNVTVTDDFNKSDSLENTYQIPDEIRIKEIAPPHDLVNNSAVTLTIFDTDEVLDNRSVTNGTVNMTGLPPDRTYIIDVDANGYEPRTVIIDSLYKQQEIYVRNSSLSSVRIEFAIDDKTGTFPSETSQILILEPLNDSFNETRYVRIAGDVPGADAAMTATLVSQTRYQIKLRNGDGDVRVLGTYVAPSNAETVTLQPSTLGISINQSAEGYAFDAYFNTTASGERISVEYADPQEQTDELTIYIHEQGNKSNAFPNTSISGPLGTAAYHQQLTANESNKTWVVNLYVDRNGETKRLQAIVGQQTYQQAPLMPDWMQEAAAMTFIVLIGGLFSVANVRTGAVVVGVSAAGFWFIGWLPDAAGGAVTFAVAIALIYKLAASRT